MWRLYLVIALFLPLTAFSADVRIFPSISQDEYGYVTFTDWGDYIDGTQASIYTDYRGQYPSGTVIAGWGGCPSTPYNSPYSYIFSGTNRMENGFLNEAVSPMYDSYYWVSLCSSCDCSTRYYFEALRDGGIWYMLEAETDLIILGGDDITSTSTTYTIRVQSTLEGLYEVGLSLEPYSILGGVGTTTAQEVTQSGTLIREYTYTLATSTSWRVRAWANDIITGDAYTDTAILHIVQKSGEYAYTQEPWEDIECSISDITGCFKKALYWAFVPSSSSIDPFLGIWNEIKYKPPIGYVYAIIEVVSNTGASSTAPYTLEVPELIQDTFFTPIRTATGFLLVVIFVFFFFKRLSHIQV